MPELKSKTFQYHSELVKWANSQDGMRTIAISSADKYGEGYVLFYHDEAGESMQSLLKDYARVTGSIFSKFGLENGYGEIDLQVDVRWALIGNEEVRWVKGGETYSNEIRRGEPRFYENWMLVWVDNGCGDQFYQVFDTNLRDESIAEL